MQLGARCAGSFRPLGLDVHVDILESTIPAEIARLDLSFDHGQAGLDFLVFLFREDACRRQRRRVGQRTLDVVRGKAPVDGARLAVELRRRVGWFLESSLSHKIISSNGRASRSQKQIPPPAKYIFSVRS